MKTAKIVPLVVCFVVAVASAAGPQAKEPFQPISGEGDALETVRHEFAISETGLPAQIEIKAAKQEIPPEKRNKPQEVSDRELLQIGRGKQLRSPMLLQATVEGKAAEIDLKKPAKLTDENADQRTYKARFQTGPVVVDLTMQYQCDGSMIGEIEYRAKGQRIDSLELILPLSGPVTLAWAGPRPGKKGIKSTRGLNPAVPGDLDKVVWDNTSDAKMRAANESFAGYLFFGSRDRGFTWICQNKKGWQIDSSQPMMTMKRDEAGALTWRAKLVNHPMNLKGKHRVKFGLMVHPARPRLEDRREKQWFQWPVKETPRQISPLEFSLADRQKAFAEKPEVLSALTGPALESCSPYMELTGQAGAAMISPEKDTVDLYPEPLFSVLAGSYTGLTTRIRPNVREVVAAGDNPAYDRQILGRALLHDIGASLQGMSQPVHYVRLLRILKDFGFFDAAQIEVLPYWQNGEYVRYGEQYEKEDAFEVTSENPASGVRVTVFRRPRDEGGYEALFVVMNERENDVRQRLYVLDPGRIFGGTNQFELADAAKGLDFSGVPDDSDWRRGKVIGAVKGRGKKSRMALKDLESGGAVRAPKNQPAGAEVYGPLFVRSHNYRILYGHGGK